MLSISSQDYTLYLQMIDRYLKHPKESDELKTIVHRLSVVLPYLETLLQLLLTSAHKMTELNEYKGGNIPEFGNLAAASLTALGCARGALAFGLAVASQLEIEALAFKEEKKGE